MLTFKQNEIDLADATKDDAARPADMSEVSARRRCSIRIPALERDRVQMDGRGA